MSYRDNGYDQQDRIVFGLPGLLILIGFLLAMVLFSTGCAESGPIRRALDSELGVLCYYTNTAMSCIPVQVKKRGQKTDEASHKTAGLPASAGGAE